ncbi:MAG: hypothetical protein K6253_03120 [Candidatus Liberibacter asiaticus]|nr:hypothetical protein [Candidatus Liberibacter asiaticus]
MSHPKEAKEAYLKETRSLLRSKIKFLGKETSSKPIMVSRYKLLVVVRYFFILLFYLECMLDYIGL